MNNNILLDELPQYTNSGLKIRTDFRESIKFELLMQDHNLSEEVKIIIKRTMKKDKKMQNKFIAMNLMMNTFLVLLWSNMEST